MKYIKEYKEDVSTGRLKSITSETKNYFDIVFADFIDIGCKSEIISRLVSNFPNDGKPNKYEQNGYRIKIILSNITKYKYTNSISNLIKYNTDIGEYLLDIESCIKKIKMEYRIYDELYMIDEENAVAEIYDPNYQRGIHRNINSKFDFYIDIWLNQF